MNKVEKLLNKYGLCHKPDKYFNALDLDLDIEAEYFVKNEQNGEFSSVKESANSMLKKLFHNYGQIVIQDTQIFSKTFGVEFKGELYPDWFLTEMTFYLEQYERENYSLLLTPVNLYSICRKFEVFSSEKDIFTEGIQTEIKIKRIFDKENEMDEIRFIMMREIETYKEKILTTEITNDFIDCLADTTREVLREKIENYRKNYVVSE